MSRQGILEEISIERERQLEKWGKQCHAMLYWLGILMEEVGEVSKAIIENEQYAKIREELIQVVAVGVAWLEHLDGLMNVPEDNN